MANSFHPHRDKLEHITKLLQMRVDRGCTVAEQETAARRVGYLLMQHPELQVLLSGETTNEETRSGTRQWPARAAASARRRPGEQSQAEEEQEGTAPVDLGFVYTRQVTDAAVLVALLHRHRLRLHSPQAELWVPFSQLISASRAAMRRDG